MSIKTTDAEHIYSSYEFKVLAVIEALKIFRVYILDIPFKIVTDCNTFTFTMNEKDLCAKIARRALMINDYNNTLTIEQRKGTRMRSVAALSRNSLCMIIQNIFISKIIQSQNIDKHTLAIKEILKTESYDNCLLIHNFLYKSHKGLDVVVVHDKMQLNIIKHFRDKERFGRKCWE